VTGRSWRRNTNGECSRSEPDGLPCLFVLRRGFSSTLSAVLVALVLSACGDDESSAGSAGVSTEAPAEVGLEHIHGLGVDGGALYIATHTGLWTAPDGQRQPQPVGDSRQDIMGFSIAGDDRFIGSGHPGPDQDLPPLLGLIESRDGGRTWNNVSLLGETDFHVLESAGRRVYGYDGSRGLLVSSDGGRAWEARTPPAAMFSLAIDPRNADRIVAATEAGLFVSVDAGRRWRPLSDKLAGLLAWQDGGRLFLVDGAGAVQLSADGGRRWQTAGNIGGQPAAFIAHDEELYAALVDGSVMRSADGGRSWTVRAAPTP
jgi:hypothetical protein